ncbi:hypothetical protein LCGC14_0702110 [marine sediment metagenome]|uniref:Uncharacterized protein n=1 Tax=marine sediment metagenome TaxID=412755 RepID=A0A0F9QM85_9ZZZZ
MIIYDLCNNEAGELLIKWFESDCKRKSEAGKALKKFVQSRRRDVQPHIGEEPPKVGDFIYVRSSDDYIGGLAEVTEVAPAEFIRVKEKPHVSMNWKYLKDIQKTLAERYGEHRAHLCG